MTNNMKTLITDLKDNIFYITINRPDAMNALNRQVFDELHQVIDTIDKDESIRALIFKGAGRTFVAGADLKELNSLDNTQIKSFIKSGHEVFRRLETLEIPVIALVHGFALGGGMELALACDIIIAHQDAKFGLPETKLGLIPGLGGTQRLIRKIPTAEASRIIFTCDMITAKKAYELGLVSEITGDLESSGHNLLAKIKNNSGVAIKHAKKAIVSGINLNLDDGLILERDLFAECFKTDDAKEGISAFISKRKPKFKHV